MSITPLRPATVVDAGEAGAATVPPTVAAPAPTPGEPTPYQRRKAREAARDAERARRRAQRRTARELGDEPDEAPAAPPADESRTDDQRADDLAVFLQGVIWPLLSLGAALFGWRLSPLTLSEAQDDARAWVPIARRYRWLDYLSTWAAAPARLVRRVREHATRQEASARTALPPSQPKGDAT